MSIRYENNSAARNSTNPWIRRSCRRWNSTVRLQAPALIPNTGAAWRGPPDFARKMQWLRIGNVNVLPGLRIIS
ncbi:hypothetical protein [Paraburkholderia sp.]|uniref:hypothetical protein n=1 Tax=Paraburkholderia sp. TaxID=1926495 RepID=UPI0025F025CD|nr:hypothetical protein [Paraburkholderia sp.]